MTKEEILELAHQYDPEAQWDDHGRLVIRFLAGKRLIERVPGARDDADPSWGPTSNYTRIAFEEVQA